MSPWQSLHLLGPQLHPIQSGGNYAGSVFFAKLLGKPNIKHRGGAIIIIIEPQSLPGTITVQGHQDSLTQSEFHSGKKSDDTFKSDAQGWALLHLH